MKQNLRFLKRMIPMLALVGLMLAPNWGWGQTTIAAWTYPTTTGNAPNTLAAECGALQASSNFYADGTNGSDNWTDVSSRQYYVGRVPTPALCAVTSATGAYSLVNSSNAYNGKSVVFKISTTGYQGLALSYDTRGTSAGFTTHVWSYSTDGTNFTTQSTINGRNATSFSTQTVDFSSKLALNNQSNVYIKLTVSGATDAGNNRLDNINFTASVSAGTPNITVGTITDFGNQQINTTSPEQTYNVSGSNLTANITITPPTGFLISTTSGSGYTSTPIILTQSEGTVTSTPIYVVFSPSLAQAYSGNITHESSGATTMNVAVSGTGTAPPDAEPTNHATSFSAIANSSGQITVTWTDATGAQLPAAYLVKAAIDPATPTAPADGTPEVNGTLVKNIAQGIQTAVFTGLNASTTYNFAIWPFTNSGAAINYKTDGTVPTTSATTEELGTLLLVENFEYSTGTDLTANGWNVTGTNATPVISVTASSISYPGYLSSGIGNEVAMTGSGQDVNKVFAAQSSGTVYASFLVNVNSASTGGDYFFHLGQTTIASTFRGRVFVKRDASNNLAFGIAQSTTTINYTEFSYSLNTTYLIVLKFDINTGETNDVSSIFINPVLNSAVPVTGWLINTDASGADLTELGSVALRQGSVSAAPSLKLDGIRISTSWADIVGPIVPATSTYSNTGNWSNATNWSNGLPGAATDVIINGNVTVDDLVTCNNMTISPLGAVTVGAGPSSGLSVNGNLLIESDATGTGSFIGAAADYDITGTTTIQRYLTGGWYGNNAGWHQLSSPVAAQPIADFTTTGAGNDYDFYGWEESTNMWMNYKDVGFSGWNGGTNFNVGQGYMVSYEAANITQTYTGAINAADVTKTNLSYNEATGNGWHLLGNPFASALKWNDGNWALSSVAGTAKIWHETNKSYSDIEASGFIPSAQGFMVQVSGGTNSMIIPTASRVHNHNVTPFYKSTSSNERILLVAAETESSSAQESKIIVNPIAIEGFDFNYDSRFLAGNAPQFYAMVADEKVSTKSLPSLHVESVIPYGFVKNQATQFTISLAETIEGKTILLTDKKTNTIQKLSENPVYSFTSAEGDNPDRFLLHFGVVGIGEQPNDAALQAYVYGNQLFVINEKGKANLQIFDVQGRLLQSNQILSEGMNSRALDLSAGVYVVRLQSAEATKSIKVIVQ